MRLGPREHEQRETDRMEHIKVKNQCMRTTISVPVGKKRFIKVKLKIQLQKDSARMPVWPEENIITNENCHYCNPNIYLVHKHVK